MRYISLLLLLCSFILAPLRANAGLLDSLFHTPEPAAAPLNLPVTFITQGNSATYSPAAERIAFARYDPSIKGAPSIDGRKSYTGTFEVWTADADGTHERCLGCFDIKGGPLRGQHKGTPAWHPSGRWLVVAVEMPVHADTHDHILPGHGVYHDLWAISAYGRQWFQLTHYANSAVSADAPAGALEPHFSNSGGKLVWSELIGLDAAHPYGIWQLASADFDFGAAGAELRNKQTFKPGDADATFYEPWSFSPDDSSVLVASDNGAGNPAFMRLERWDPKAGTLTPLTQGKDQFTEQGMFSPDGSLIAYMSTEGQTPPYQPRMGQFMKTFRTDVWVMRADGSHGMRVTFINDEVHPQYQIGQHLVVPAGWMSDQNLLFTVVPVSGGRQEWENNKIYRLDLP